MSEFYSLRRNAITDISAFFGFLIGFLGSSPIAWPYLQVGFQTQEIVKGFTWFIVITFGAGVLVGILGLGVGRLLGGMWEGGHRVVRRARGHEFAIEGHGIPLDRPVPAYPTSAHTVDARASGIRMAASVNARDIVALAARSGVPVPDAGRLQESLARTINIGAYDGEELVGIVRLLTDGFAWSVITDLLVAPSHRRQGIGTALMRTASERATGRLTVAHIPPGTEGFFRRLEAIPAYEGFVRGAKSRLT